MLLVQRRAAIWHLAYMKRILCVAGQDAFAAVRLQMLERSDWSAPALEASKSVTTVLVTKNTTPNASMAMADICGGKESTAVAGEEVCGEGLVVACVGQEAGSSGGRTVTFCQLSSFASLSFRIKSGGKTKEMAVDPVEPAMPSTTLTSLTSCPCSPLQVTRVPCIHTLAHARPMRTMAMA